MMTINGWGLFIILAVLIYVICIGIAYSVDRVWVGVILGTLLTIAIFAAFQFYFGHTEAGARAIKTEQSNLCGGIDRTVEVYDATGNLIKTYHGKFDVDYDDNRIVFDDENNMRHVIYYPTGTVIIDENE